MAKLRKIQQFVFFETILGSSGERKSTEAL